MVEIIEATNHKLIDRSTADFINVVTSFNLEYNDNEEVIDMCKSVEEYTKKQNVIGAINAFRLDGASDNDVVKKVMKLSKKSNLGPVNYCWHATIYKSNCKIR